MRNLCAVFFVLAASSFAQQQGRTSQGSLLPGFWAEKPEAKAKARKPGALVPLILNHPQFRITSRARSR